MLGFMLNSSLSLIVAMDSGDRTTDPGVMLGSSSMDLICVPYYYNSREEKREIMNSTGVKELACGTPKSKWSFLRNPNVFTFQGFPGSNSGTRSVNEGCVGAAHCASFTSGAPESPAPVSGQPVSVERPLDHGLFRKEQF